MLHMMGKLWEQDPAVEGTLMIEASETAQRLALEVFSYESRVNLPSGSNCELCVAICEKLRIALTQFAGRTGYISLLSRALKMASNRCPVLAPVSILADGRIAGLPVIDRLSDGTTLATDPGVIIVSELIVLLIIFIGKRLTEAIILDIWPIEALTGSGSHGGVKL